MRLDKNSDTTAVSFLTILFNIALHRAAKVIDKRGTIFTRLCQIFEYAVDLTIISRTENELKNTEEDEISPVQDNKNVESAKNSELKSSTALKENPAAEMMDRATLNLIYKAVKDNADENGWANLSMVGQYISAVKPDFDSRNYGRAKLSGLIKTLNLFETKIEMSQMYLRKLKKQSA